MKTYTIFDEVFGIDGSDYYIAGGTPLVKHTYSLPAERSQLYNDLYVKSNARNPENLLEPEQGDKLSVDVDFEYNYYVKEYEEGIAEVYDVPYSIPSLNLFLLKEEDLLSYNERTYYLDLFSGYGKIEGFTRDNLVPKSFLSRDYFVDFGKVSQIGSLPSELRETYDSKPIFVNKEMTKIYQDLKNKREMFPFFGKVSIEGVSNSEVANILEDFKLEETFVDFIEMHREDYVNEVDYAINGDDENTSRHTIRIMPKDTFYAHIKAGHGGNVKTYSMEEEKCSYFESFLLTNLAKKKIDNYIKSAQLGASTPVAYRVEKVPLESTSTEKSVHYFFNYRDIESFFLYDTQVSYGVGYQYNVTIINSYIGLKDGLKELIFLEEYFYTDGFEILDSPPIAPDVELITYRGVSDKVLILFNQMIDKKVLSPVIIRSGDQEDFERQREAQKIPDPNPIIFESDDPANFELFKTTTKPTSYLDFANTYYKFVDSKGLTAASYEDTIIPNQTYYYTFRASDVHGFVSNPTPVYEFTLLKDGETLYPKIRIVDFAPPEPPTQKSKTFKRYLKIGFAPGQEILPVDQKSIISDELINKDIKVGIEKDNLIGSNRTFKFRLRSKNTGKLMDINVTFKKNKVIKA
jgi:hypothetical protein